MPSTNLNHEYPEINHANANALAIGALNGILKSDGADNFSAATIDNTPTENSTNLVASGGVFSAVKAATDGITPKRTSSNAPANSSFSVLCDTAIAGEAKPKLYGKSAVINQLAPELTSANYTLGVATITDGVAIGTQNAAGAIVGCPFYYSTHTYYAAADIKLTSAVTSVYLRANGRNLAATAASTAWQTVAAIFNVTDTSGTALSVYDARTSGWDAVQAKNFQLIDLTAIFTAAELTAIGTSVSALKTAWLAKFGYPLPAYLPYDTGSIVSNNATYQMHGRNIWDEEWEVGSYSATTGEPTYSSTTIRSKAANYIPIIGGAEYYIKTPQSTPLFFYDANKAYITTVTRVNQTFTAPAEARYMRFRVSSDYGTTYNNDICINLSDADNGTYTPYYNGGSVTADNLNGIGTALDSQDAEGQIVRRIGSVDLGTLTFSASTLSGVQVFVTANGVLPDATTSSNVEANTLCARYAWHRNTAFDGGDKYIVIDGNKRVIIRDSSYSDAESLMATLSGLMLYYELATPTTSTTTPSDLTTQAGYNSLAPVAGDVQSGDASVEYPVDVIAYIDKKLAEL